MNKSFLLALVAALHLKLEDSHFYFLLGQVLVSFLVFGPFLLLRHFQLGHRHKLAQHLTQPSAELFSLIDSFLQGLSFGVEFLHINHHTSSDFHAKLVKVIKPSPSLMISSTIFPNPFRFLMLTVTSWATMNTE